MLNVTGKDMATASEAVPSMTIKFEQIHRDFKVDTSSGVQVGRKGDYLLQFSDGDYGIATPEEFASEFSVVKSQSAEDYLKDRGIK